MFRLACFFVVACAANAVAQLPELKPVELVDWDCLNKPEGIAKTEDGKERNRQKNRSPAILATESITSVDIPAFLVRVADYDRQIEKKHRRDLSPAQKEQVIALVVMAVGAEMPHPQPFSSLCTPARRQVFASPDCKKPQSALDPAPGILASHNPLASPFTHSDFNRGKF